MSTSLMRRATERLKSQATALQRKRAENKKEEELLFAGVGTLAGGGAGAFIDTKGQNGGPHKLFAKADGTGGLPTNIVAGALIAVPAIAIKKFPLKAPIAAAGLGLATVGLYRYLVDKHAANAAANP
jgi:hypothetical protein